LTSPTGREYIPGVVKRGDSSAGAGIRGVPGKANSYPSAASFTPKIEDARKRLAGLKGG
jgi:hypothetical protein